MAVDQALKVVLHKGLCCGCNLSSFYCHGNVDRVQDRARELSMVLASCEVYHTLFSSCTRVAAGVSMTSPPPALGVPVAVSAAIAALFSALQPPGC